MNNSMYTKFKEEARTHNMALGEYLKFLIISREIRYNGIRLLINSFSTIEDLNRDTKYQKIKEIVMNMDEGQKDQLVEKIIGV